MPLDQKQEKSLSMQLLIGRLLVVALCFGSIAMYAAVYVAAVLKGNLKGFLIGFRSVPFTSPPVIILLAISAVTFVAVLVLLQLFQTKIRFKPSSVLGLNIVSLLIASAGLETIAIYGLVLGFMFGPALSSLTLAMFLVTIAGGIAIFPRSNHWRSMLEKSISSAKQ